MRILLIGSGGREHAIAWKLAQSPRLTQLFVAPGNAGTAQCGTNVDVDVADHDAVARFCESEQVDMVIVGPEVPLVAGLCDSLSAKLPRLKLVGPGAAGAQLEGSKAFSKALMAEFEIPTAAYEATLRTTRPAPSSFAKADPALRPEGRWPRRREGRR